MARCKSRGGMSEVSRNEAAPFLAPAIRAMLRPLLRIGGPITALLPNRLPGLDFGLGETADMLRGQVEAFVADAIAPCARAS